MSSNMHLLYFNFVVLLSVCGLRCVDCEPTLTPLKGSKVFEFNGSNYYDLTWDYNTDGRTIKEVQLKYIGVGNNDVTVAGRSPTGQLQVSPASGYTDSKISSFGSLSGNVGQITFRISKIVQSDSRIFKCELSFNSFNPPDVQSSVELVVVVAPRITLKSPRTVTVDEGNTITLLCVATGNPKPTITWTKDSEVKQKTSITNYTISPAAKKEAGTYTCEARVAAPGLGEQTDNYQVTVTVRYKPQISSLTPNQTINDGNDVLFSCRANAVPPPTAYNWFKNGVPIPSGSSVGFVNSGQDLTVTNVQRGSAGRYSCSSTNVVGTGEERSTFLSVNYAPQTVTVTPNPAVVKLSQSITLDCTADGYPVPTFSWQLNGALVGGATQKTYALNNAKVEDAGNYSCLASNFRGEKKAFLVVNVEYAPTATTFTTGTPNNAVVQGTSVTLTCSANGYPAPVYTLKLGNTILVQNSATGTYVISNVQLNTNDGQVYSCEPSNAEGSGPPQSLTLTVHVRPRFNPPQTLPTTKQIRNEKQTMDYTCTAEAKPYASIRWMLNGQNLTNIAPYNITERISGPAASRLFTTFGYLNIKHLTWQQYGNFSCVAINDAGSVKQNTELEVRYRPVVQSPADHPKNLTLAEGETATFNCKTIGNPPTTAHKWQFKGNDLQGEACNNCPTTTLRIGSVERKDEGSYGCVGTNSLGDGPPAKAQLLIKSKPTIDYFPKSVYTVNETDNITMVCGADGVPRPTITWKNMSSGRIVGEGEEFHIVAASETDDGVYICFAQNELGDDSKGVTLQVQNKPQITFLTANQTANDGTDVSFFCRADAVPTPTAYNWFKNGVTIPSGPSGDFVNSGQELTVKNVKKDSAGRYSCSSTNIVGTGEEKSTFLAVNYAPQTVTVTPNPAVVKLSQSITLDCAADGYPVPAFSWQFNGAVVGGVTQKTYALNNAKVEDAGNYSCLARNFRGTKKATRVVNVEYAPTATTFTTGTPNNAVVQGTSVTLTCSANGYPAPVYTLKRGNTVLVQNSATGTYDISNVQLNTHDGQVYSCEPSNAEGSGPPQSLTLTVHVRPRFNPPQTLPTTKQIRNENQTMDYTCTAEAKPYASIRWMLNGQNLTKIAPYNITERISGPAASKLFMTFGYLNIKYLTWQQYGNFSCVAINDAGSVKQNTELEVRYRPVVQSPADHPKNLTLAEGETATFNCKTIGNPPTTAHKWQFNGNDLQGEACNNCPTTTLRIGSVERKDEGWYGCVGTNSLGDGPPAKAQLLIKRKPTIDYFPKKVYTVNETNNITMVCGADGVPTPTITWRKTSIGKIIGEGEEFHILAASETDDGVYICFAQNELGDDSREVTLKVQTRPTILTSTPITTNIPGATGEQVDLTCIVKGKPSPTLSWRRDPNGNDLSAIDEKVESITNQVKATTMKIIVTTAGKEVGDKFYCVATNILGNDTQQYIIRERGPPDPPQDVKVVPFAVPDSQTVSVNVSWTPGYSGGYDQQFSIHYRKKGSGSDFTEVVIGLPPNDMHTVQQLSPNTTYEFMMQASNQLGNSGTSPLAQVTTTAATVDPARGSVTATRVADDPTEIVVTWTVTDILVNKLNLEIFEGGEGSWSAVSGASDMTPSTTQFRVKNLKADAKYKFRLDMRRPGENNPTYVESNEVPAVPIVGKREEPLKNWMIAVIAAVGGVLLIGIVILCLCCFMRRKKSLGADRVNMSQTSSYVVGGPPDVSRSLDTRPRSYGMESVEDDPFIEAHFASMQSMNSTDGKKKKGDSGVNLGYLSQDSVQPQSEMLMNPGSRLSRNHPVAQSTGDLDSAYPARGPQRDFNTLPPYHEPPSFEEAMRQSGRKPKIRKSTGDLTGPGQGRHAGRRPRPSPSDEPTDSSDGETRFTPQRTAPPPPRVRPNELNDDPRYAPVDQQGRVLGPRVLPQGLSTTSAPRNGPIDPTVPYSMPQKKKSTKKPRSEPSEPAIGPPPQYTPEDRSPAEPMHYPGDLDLDDPVNLPRSERPPDLPPPMAMLPSNRGMSNYHHDPHDGLPEPPAFLRDVVYPPYGRDTQSDSDGPAPYNPPPPSANRQRKPYVNIHGQLVRPPSRESDEFLRPESLRSSRDTLTPEPEMPVRPRQPRGSEFDDRREPEINYFSYLV